MNNILGTDKSMSIDMGMRKLISLGVLMFCAVLHTASPSAREILKTTGTSGGLVVHLGCGDGRLTAALRANDSYLVHGLDDEYHNVKSARNYINSIDMYGKVSVDTFNGKNLPYVDNLINLLVAEELGDVTMEEVMRVLVPQGTAYVKQDGKWKVSVKQRPESIDEWTHYLYNASGNAVSGDKLVGPTRYLKWVAGPLHSRSHEYTPSLVAMVSANGKIFSIEDNGVRGVFQPSIDDRWNINARDSFNGKLLRKRPMPKGWSTSAWGGSGNWSSPMSIPRRLVAVRNRVYVTLGYRSSVTVLDAETGDVVRELAGTENTDEIVLIDKTLLVRIRKTIPDYSKKANPWNVQFGIEQELPPASPGDETIAAIDVDSGKSLWQFQDMRVATLSLAACKGRVCYHNFEELVCLNLKSGEEIWRVDCPSWPDLVGTSGTLVMYGDIVFYSADRGTFAFDATNGHLLWQGLRIRRTGIRHTADLLIANGLLWSGITKDMPSGTIPAERSPYAAAEFSGVALNGLDPRTGQIKKQIDIEKLMSDGHHIRCYRSKATERYLMWSKRGTEFVDVVEGENHMRTDWLRGECSYGVMPSNGLVYAPPHSCICYHGVQVNGFFAGSVVPVLSSASKQDQRL